MPMSILNGYSRMLPRLEAQEAMQMATVIAMGGGHLKKGDSRRIMASWKRAANVHVHRVQDPAEIRAMMTSLGVG